MFNPYRFPFPMPKSSTSPWAFSDQVKKYPFPIPSEELHPEFPWPKSLCHFAEQCPVQDDFSDKDKVEDCINALKFGCPLFLLEFDDFEEYGECKNVLIFEIGQVESKTYTEKDLERIVENFNKLIKTHRPPLVALGHGENQELLQKSGLPAAGWVSSLKAKGKKLIADFKEVPDLVVKAIKNAAYRFPSVEIYRNFTFDDVEFGPVLRRVALLGADIPRIKSLGDVVARYEEGDGAEELFLPMINSKSQESTQTIWLGGEPMSQIKVKPLKIVGTFKIGEEVFGDASDFRGKLDEFSEDNTLTITITAGTDLSKDIVLTGKDSNAKAQLVEPKQEFVEKVLTIDPKEGEFKTGERVFLDGNREIFATVKTAEKNKLTILMGKDLVDKLSTEGTLVGELSAAKAAYPYPTPYKGKYPAPEKSSEEMQALKDEVEALRNELKQERSERESLQRKAETYEERILTQEQARTHEKRMQHLKEVDSFCEDMKKLGLAPAVVDEDDGNKLSLKRYAMTLDWQKTMKFGEGEGAVEKTHFELFAELIDRMATMHSKGKAVFIPLDRIGKTDDELQAPSVPTGVDQESAALDRDIQAFSEKHEVTYSDAFRVFSEAIAKNCKPEDVALKMIPGFKTKKE